MRELAKLGPQSSANCLLGLSSAVAEIQQLKPHELARLGAIGADLHFAPVVVGRDELRMLCAPAEFPRPD